MYALFVFQNKKVNITFAIKYYVKTQILNIKKTTTYISNIKNKYHMRLKTRTYQSL